MRSEELHTHQVIIWSYARRHGKIMPAIVGDRGVYGPLTIIQAVLSNLEPLEICCTGCCSIVYLGQVVLYRT